jgi:hypothetical protein
MNLSEREKDFKKAVFQQNFPPDILENFYDYWSEPNKSATKMKFELEKTWEITRRLKTWVRNNQNWNKNGTHQQFNGQGAKLGTSAARIEAARNF